MDLVWDSILPGDAPIGRAALIRSEERGRERVCQAVEAAGWRVAPLLGLSDGLSWLGDRNAADAVLIDVTGEDEGEPLLLQTADAFCTARSIPLHVSGPLAAVDMMAGCVNGRHATWLCDPSPAERISALALERDPRSIVFNDISTDMDPHRLRRLADEVTRIARALSSLSAVDGPERGYGHQGVSDIHMPFRAENTLELELAMPSPEEIRKILRLRRLRDQYFAPDLFADPAWDMLLDLMAARLERVQVAVSSLCIAAAVPPTTALRWIKTMSDHGLFERCADPDDGRRIFIRLADTAMRGMARYFEAAKKAGGLVI